MIIIENIAKKFGRKHVFDSFSFKIKEGNFYTLLGKNGLGKSTIIKIISGFLRPNNGEIIIDNEKIYKNKAFHFKEKIGCLLEEPYYIEKFTIYEYLVLISKLSNIEVDEYHNKIDYYLDYFECSDHKDVLIEKCSKGIQQKTSIISTLLHDPKYLILDEPFTALDSSSKEKLLILLKDFCKNGGAVLLTTHDYKFVVEATDHFFILNKRGKNGTTILHALMNSYENQSEMIVKIEQLINK
jgi:ABC-type multidrug transport system ATPase subunit